MPTENRPQAALTLRIGQGTLSTAVATAEGSIVYEPYVVRSGISIAANLREAFRQSDLLLEAPPRVRVLLDTDTLVVPIEQFSEATMATMMHHAFPSTEHDVVCHNVMPDMNSVAVFAVNSDLHMVLDDHFRDVQLIAAAMPVWRYLHQRSYTGTSRKLFAYFHEKRLDVLSFQQNRFKFCNTFDAARPHDALYFMLYVWKQLQLDAEHDELHLVGSIPQQPWLTTEVKKYLAKVYVVNPQADFSDHPATQTKGMPTDMQLLFIKGR